MIPRRFNHLLVLVAGFLILAYAISTDEPQTASGRREPDDDDDGDDGKTRAADIANLVDAASAAGQFGTWCMVVKEAGLIDDFEGEGPFTLFAPTDDAFRKLGEQLDELLADTGRLRAIIQGHVVAGAVSSADLNDKDKLKTAAGTTLTVSTGDGITIDNAKIIEPDLTASNGVIHGIDTVLITKPKRTRSKKST